MSIIAGMVKRYLSPEQVLDAARLKALFAERVTMSQAEFGAEYDIGSQGAVWQYINGKMPLNAEAAVKFARALNCDVADFSPYLAAKIANMASVVEQERNPYTFVTMAEGEGVGLSFEQAFDLVEIIVQKLGLPRHCVLMDRESALQKLKAMYLPQESS